MPRDYKNKTGKNAVRDVSLKRTKRKVAPKKSTTATRQRAADLKRAQEAAKSAGKRKYGREHAKARMIMATNKNKREGTYSSYNPLSSISAPKPKQKRLKETTPLRKRSKGGGSQKPAKARPSRSKRGKGRGDT